MRRTVTGLALVAATAALAGCVPFANVCPAVGYSSTLHLEVGTAPTGLALAVCTGEGCTPSADASPAPDIVPVETTDGWSVSFLFGGPEVVGYRVTDAAGAVAREGHVRPEWERIDGTERCGGNFEAHVTL